MMPTTTKETATTLIEAVDEWTNNDDAGYFELTELVVERIVPFLRELVHLAAAADLNDRFKALLREKE